MWNRVVRFSPTGEVDRVVEVPAQQVTNCTFGGSDLKTLYVTTARQGLTEAELTVTPHAGSLFALQTDVTGMADNRFTG